MDLSVLARMKTDSLLALQKGIEETLAQRLDTTIAVGRMATFFNPRDGKTHTVRIDRVLIKNVSCTEVAPDAGKRWRISPSMLKMVPVERKVALPEKAPLVKHVPKSFEDAMW